MGFKKFVKKASKKVLSTAVKNAPMISASFATGGIAGVATAVSQQAVSKKLSSMGRANLITGQPINTRTISQSAFRSQRLVAGGGGGDIIVGPGGGSSLPPDVRGVKSMSIIRGGFMIARSVGGKIISITTAAGKKFNRKQIVAAARKFGPEAAAAALGVEVVNVLEAILDDSAARPRRRRGITPRDLQCARNTIRKMQTFNKSLGLPAARRAPVRRKTACR